MFNVADYFKKFAKIEGESLALRSAVLDALKQVCGVEKADFELKKGILIMKGHPVVKSVVFMKKKEVLEHLSRTSPQSKVSDIR